MFHKSNCFYCGEPGSATDIISQGQDLITIGTQYLVPICEECANVFKHRDCPTIEVKAINARNHIQWEYKSLLSKPGYSEAEIHELDRDMRHLVYHGHNLRQNILDRI